MEKSRALHENWTRALVGLVSSPVLTVATSIKMHSFAVADVCIRVSTKNRSRADLGHSVDSQEETS